MTPMLSGNAQSILLLTAPLIAGRGSSQANLLTPGEYNRLARHLRHIQHQPADLLSPNATPLLRECRQVIEESRLQHLLGRGFLLSQVIEKWQSMAIWVVSRADSDYPRLLKSRLREDAPAILYGCGDVRLLESGGLAIVGSRHVEESLLRYAMTVGALAARAERTVISGGAKGIDQAAMRGALDAGGKVSGVLADGLEKASLNREHRGQLIGGRLALISPYDPAAGFHVGNAMQRNKLIYALANASLVVSSDYNKGGTWSGATEQLDKYKFVPVYIRSTGESSAGLDALRKKGAILWPNPQDVRSFAEMFNVPMAAPATSTQIGLSFPASDETAHSTSKIPSMAKIEAAPEAVTELSSSVIGVQTPSTTVIAPENMPSSGERDEPQVHADIETEQASINPADSLFARVREAIPTLLSTPMRDAEIAAALNLTIAQTKVWLRRLEKEGVLERRKATSEYAVREQKVID
jgi:DNA processing protein